MTTLDTENRNSLKNRFLVFAIKLNKRKTTSQKKNVVNFFVEVFNKTNWKTRIINVESIKGTLLIGERASNPKTVIIADLSNGEPQILTGKRFDPLNRLENKKIEMKNAIAFMILKTMLTLVGVLLVYFGRFKLDNILFQILGVLVIAITIAVGYFSQSKTHISKDAALFALLEFASNYQGNDISICLFNSSYELDINQKTEECFPNSTIVFINQLSYEGDLTVLYTKNKEQKVLKLKSTNDSLKLKLIENEYDSILYPISGGIIITTIDSKDNKTVYPGSKDDCEVDMKLLSMVPKLLQELERN